MSDLRGKNDFCGYCFRYRLPQIISFVDDEIKKVYTQDLLEGIENMKTITGSYKENRASKPIQRIVLLNPNLFQNAAFFLIHALTNVMQNNKETPIFFQRPHFPYALTY